MKCPRCTAALHAAPDESGLVVCASCGARLRTRVPAVARVAVAAGATPSAAAEAMDLDSMLSRLDAPPSVISAKPGATLPPGTPLMRIPPRREPVAGAFAEASHVTLETLLAEVRALRRTQDEILGLLRARQGDAARAGRRPDEVRNGADPGEHHGPRPASVRSRHRKNVVLIDDDPATRQAALEALGRAEVPARAFGDGNAGLAAIAEEKPDVIILELGVDGAMPGKDLINMIKATMEWVDIPIVLYTRTPVSNQKEARTIHGADELVPKGLPGAADALVAQVIAVFRKG